jgi:hypothetical protein
MNGFVRTIFGMPMEPAKVPEVKAKKIYEIVEYDDIAKSIELGFLHHAKHPNDPQLRLFTATKKVVDEGLWDNVTLSLRGVIAKKGTIIARPYRKILNLGDARYPETMEHNLPVGIKPDVTELLDGVMGILYTDPVGKPAIATLDGFMNPVAQWATKEYRKEHGRAKWPKGYTPVFEILIPIGRVLIGYWWERLILTGLVNNETGAELPHDQVSAWAVYNRVYCVEKAVQPLERMQTFQGNGKKGFVITYNLGQHTPPLKLKWTYPTYMKTKTLMGQVNAHGLWQLMKAEADLSPLFNSQELPPGFIKWVKEWQARLTKRFNEVEFQAMDTYTRCPHKLEADNPDSRKHIAMWFQEQTKLAPHLTPAMFAMLNEQDYRPHIWTAVRRYR